MKLLERVKCKADEWKKIFVLCRTLNQLGLPLHRLNREAGVHVVLQS